MIWGIVIGAIALWLLVSVVLGVLIGRSVRIADAHRADQDFVIALSRNNGPGTTRTTRIAPTAPVAPRAASLV
ncbi:MAG TPA: hypothetical protein VIL55_11070 [Naasia sp.]